MPFYGCSLGLFGYDERLVDAPNSGASGVFWCTLGQGSHVERDGSVSELTSSDTNLVAQSSAPCARAVRVVRF